jgi:hypothetical protein
MCFIIGCNLKVSCQKCFPQTAHWLGLQCLWNICLLTFRHLSWGGFMKPMYFFLSKWHKWCKWFYVISCVLLNLPHGKKYWHFSCFLSYLKSMKPFPNYPNGPLLVSSHSTEVSNIQSHFHPWVITVCCDALYPDISKNLAVSIFKVKWLITVLELVFIILGNKALNYFLAGHCLVTLPWRRRQHGSLKHQ